MALGVKGDKTRVPTDSELAAATKSERLICNDVDDNNNKMWNGFVFSNGDAFCQWGRVNKAPQHEYYAFGDTYEAERWLERKTNDKMNYSDKAPYTRQRTVANSAANSSAPAHVSTSSLKKIATEQITGDPEVKKLVAWLADVNVHTITKNTQITYNIATGGFSTPLGLVTPDGISEARTILGDLEPFVRKHDWESQRYKKLLSDYLRIIPQDLGMTRGWHTTLLAASDSLQKQLDILDSLEALLIVPVSATPTKSIGEKVFSVKLETVSDSGVFTRIKKKYNSDKGNHYDVRDYDVKKVWAVEISTVKQAFERDGRKVGNIMDLWHGTSAANLLSILKGGLKLSPPSTAAIAGKAFGNGVYFSDQSTKSIRYATGAWGQGSSSRIFMFTASVAMGKHYEPRGYQNSSFKPPHGYDSTFARANTGSVSNNEMIVYRESQINLDYLIEFGK